MTDQVETKEQTTEAAPQANTSAAAELNIQDLNAMKVIIDIASSRGAFKPSEMTTVGQTYTKLSAFLEAVAKQADGAKQ